VVEWCASTASTTVSLGGVAQRGLDVRRIVMDLRRVEAFVWRHRGVNNRLGKGYADLCPEDGPTVDGDDGC
jgi:hypothetical protein